MTMMDEDSAVVAFDEETERARNALPGDSEAAISIYNDLLNRRLLPNDHPRVIVAREELAQLFHDKKLYNLAVDELHKVVTYLQLTNGPGPHSQALRQNKLLLVQCLVGYGQIDEACRIATSGDPFKHSKTSSMEAEHVIALSRVAQRLFETGNFAPCTLHIFQIIYGHYVKAIGEEKRETIKARWQLARAKYENGEKAQAKRLAENNIRFIDQLSQKDQDQKTQHEKLISLCEEVDDDDGDDEAHQPNTTPLVVRMQHESPTSPVVEESQQYAPPTPISPGDNSLVVPSMRSTPASLYEPSIRSRGDKHGWRDKFKSHLPQRMKNSSTQNNVKKIKNLSEASTASDLLGSNGLQPALDASPAAERDAFDATATRLSVAESSLRPRMGIPPVTQFQQPPQPSRRGVPASEGGLQPQHSTQHQRRANKAYSVDTRTKEEVQADLDRKVEEMAGDDMSNSAPAYFLQSSVGAHTARTSVSDASEAVFQGRWLDSNFRVDQSGETADYADDFMYNLAQAQKVVAASDSGIPVKICLIDSGFDGNNPELTSDKADRVMDCLWFDEQGLPQFAGPLRNWRNTRRTDGYVDKVGHGTHCGDLLLQVAPPNAEIYVAKVVNGRGWPNPEFVAQAIQHASNKDGWNVDIISISLGFPNTHDDIQNAIKQAGKKVAIFAAASNQAASQENIAFPARMTEVICIKSTDGHGKPSGFNPINKVDSGRGLMTLGESALAIFPRYELPDRRTTYQLRVSGTSIATPIAAGIGALLIEFIRQRDDPSVDNSHKPLEASRALLEKDLTGGLVNLLSEPMVYRGSKVNFIQPWLLLRSDETARVTSLNNVHINDRVVAANQIYTCLRGHVLEQLGLRNR